MATVKVNEEPLVKISEAEMLQMIKDGQKDKTQKQYAVELGVSPQYLNDVLHGNRTPGSTILDALGITKQTKVEYFCMRRKKAADGGVH